MKKNLFAIIFFILSLSQLIAQKNSMINDTIVLDEVSVEVIKIPKKEKQGFYPISEIKFTDLQTLTPQINLSEYLESIPGLFINNNNNYAQDSRISIRGFGSRANFGIRGIKIFVDGIPETSPDGQSQIDNINLELIENIKVYRGNNSSFFGSSSGGVISITTLDDFQKNFINLGYSFGSFDTKKTQATVGFGDYKKKIIFFLAKTKSNGFRDHSSYENLNVNFKYIKKIGFKNRLQIITNILDSPDAQDPGGLNINEVISNRSQGRARNISYDSREKVKQYKFGINLYSKINRVKLTNSIYFNQRLFDGKLPIASGGIIDLKRSFWGYNVNLGFEGLLDYNFGFSINNQKDDRLRYTNKLGVKSEKVMDQEEKYRNASLFFFGSKNLNKYSFSIGLSLEQNKISLDNYFLTSLSETNKISSFNPSLNILRGFKGFNLFANFSTGYETPTLNELSATVVQTGFNKNLKSVQSKTFEIGISNYGFKKKIQYNLRLFNILTTNEITPYESDLGQTLYQNAGKTSKKGIELELDSKMNKNISFNYSYTYGIYKFENFLINEKNFSKNHIPGIPKRIQKLNLNYSNEKNLKVILSFKNIGKMFADNSNETLISSYSLIGLKFSKKIKLLNQNITPFLSIDNMFNKEYFDNIRINAFGSRFYEPAPKINYVAGLKINL